MPFYEVTYTKKYKGLTEEISQEVEAKSPSDAKRQVMKLLEKEVTDYFSELKETYPKMDLIIEIGTSVLGVWQGKAVPAQSSFSSKPYVSKKAKVILKYQGFKVAIIEQT